LRRADKEVARKIPTKAWRGFSTVGLILERKLVADYYDWCTPKNCWTFAHTGGNGVHFSLLARDGAVRDDSPVVLTNPGGMGHSCIVGEDLHDFLCLGALRGYFGLEQLTYNPELTLEVYTDPKWQPSEEWHYAVGYVCGEQERQVLDLLAAWFQLRHWTVRAKFARLQKEYLGQLDLPTDVAI
jgi:hypothetical protein